MIVATASGWMTLNALERRLNRSRRAIAKRAKEMGVKLPRQQAISRPRPRRKVEEAQPIDRFDYECTTGTEDPLLDRLKKYHSRG